MSRIRIRAAALALSLAGAVLLTACLGDTTTSGPPDDSPRASFLVFVSDRATVGNLYRVDADGVGLRQVTGARGIDSEPDCLVGGAEVVFTSTGRNGPEPDIYLLTSTGLLQRLTVRQGTGQADFSPVWSPDGQRIAFITAGRQQFGGAQNRVATMNPDGTIVEGVGQDLQGVDMDWSAAGGDLAVATEGTPADGDLDLITSDLQGNVRTLAADGSVSETHPAWSGTGDFVAFTRRNPDGSGGDIYRVAPDGSDLRQLTTDDAMDAFPDASPDGSEIAFASDRSGNFEIYVMDADGGNVRRVTNHPARDDQPTWCVRRQ